MLDAPDLREAERRETFHFPRRPRKRPLSNYSVLKIAPTPFFADYGCHVRIYEETLALGKLGNKVTICTYHSGNDIGTLDIRRALNALWRRDGQVGSSMHQLQKLYYDALLSAKCAQVAVRTRPDIIHAHMHEGTLIGYFLSRTLRVPLVFDFQGSLTSEMLDHHFIRRDHAFFRPLRRLERTINRMAHAVITSSENAAHVLVAEHSYPADRVFTVTDSVNTEVFVPRSDLSDPEIVAATKTRLGIPSGRSVVVYLGLLAEYQGTVKLLEAARHLIDSGQRVHFLIMGYPGEDYYRNLAAAMGLADYVTFTGRVSYVDAPLLLTLGDVAVSPKISETEGNGKLLNYMGCGLPTVTFDTPVAREILGPFGVYAETGCSDDLASKLGRLLSNQDMRFTLGAALRERAVNEFSWQKAGEKIMEVYAKVAR